MPASVYEPISTVLKNSFYGPKSSGLGSKLDSSLQKSLLVPVSVLCELLLWHYFFKLSIPQVQYDDAVRQTPNLSEKQKSKYIILTASNPAMSGSPGAEKIRLSNMSEVLVPGFNFNNNSNKTGDDEELFETDDNYDGVVKKGQDDGSDLIDNDDQHEETQDTNCKVCKQSPCLSGQFLMESIKHPVGL